MVPPARFERATSPLGGARSIQLSYRGNSEEGYRTRAGGESKGTKQQGDNSMIQMTPELAADLVRFQPINAQASRPDANPSIDDDVARIALEIVRNHIDALAPYFAKRLAQVALNSDTPNLKFHFQDVNEAAECFRMSAMQKIDEKRARALGVITLNLLLHDLRYPSCFEDDEDEAHWTAMLLAAQNIDAHRHMLAREFLGMAEARVGQQRNRQLLLGAGVLGVAALLWLALF